MPGIHRPAAPSSIAMPLRNFSNPDDQNTPRATNGRMPMMTPGMGIGLATPGLSLSLKTSNQGSTTSPVSAVSDLKTPFKASEEKSGDYFAARPSSRAGTPSATSKVPSTPSEPDEKAAAEPEKVNGKESGGLFGKKNKFRMSFVGKKPPKPVQVVAKPVVEEKTKEESDAESRTSKADEERELYADCFYGVVHQIRHEYSQALEKGETHLDTLVTPCLPNETPVLKPPMTTTVLIQEESHTSAGMTDLFEGRLDVLKQQANVLEKVAPFWLGDLLLRVCFASSSI
jgi:WD repeat-containing protein 48